MKHISNRQIKFLFCLITFSFFPFEILNAQCTSYATWHHGGILYNCNNDNFVLAFEENFDGNSLNIDDWYYSTGVVRDQDFSHGKQWFLENNVSVSNGTLKLTARKEIPAITGSYVEGGVPKTTTFDYSSGEIRTRRKFYLGKYEIRCRAPSGKGFWSAFWTFGGQTWNEVDVFELYGANADEYTCNIYSDHDNDTNPTSCQFKKDNYVNIDDWHTYTAIVDIDKIYFYVDNNLVRVHYRVETVSNIGINCGDNVGKGTYYNSGAYPLENMEIIIGLGIESGAKAPNNNTFFPSNFEIDWVRFYKRKSCCFDKTYNSLSDFSFNSEPKVYNFDCGNNLIIDGNIDLHWPKNINLKAKNSIDIKPGFETYVGALFSAQIGYNGCASPRLSSKNNGNNDTETKGEVHNKYESFKIVPNPNNGSFFLNTNLNELERDLKVAIYSQYGELIQNKQLSNVKEAFEINSGSSKGLYFIVISENNNRNIIFKEKLVIF